MIQVYTPEFFMRQALYQAERAFEEGEVPVGAVVVCKNQIIARAHNQTERLTDVTAHAEMLAITSAAAYLGSKYLNECTLYVTLEPCSMCAGALAWAQLEGLVFAAHDEKRGFSRHTGILHPKTTIQSGILEEQASSLIHEFFKKIRK